MLCLGVGLAIGLYAHGVGGGLAGQCAGTAYWPHVLVLSAESVDRPVLGSPDWRSDSYVRCHLIVQQGWKPAYADVTYRIDTHTGRAVAMWSDLPGMATRPLWP